MKRKVLDTLCIGMMAMGVSTAGAFEVNQVRIIRIESANSAGHTWVAISGLATARRRLPISSLTAGTIRPSLFRRRGSRCISLQWPRLLRERTSGS